MAVPLVDIPQLNIFDTIMSAYLFDRADDFGTKFGIDNEYDPRTGIVGPSLAQQFAQCRTELKQTFPRHVFIQIFSKGTFSPVIVGRPENQQDVGRAKTRKARYEGTMGIIFPIVSGIRDSGTAIAVILSQYIAAL